MNPVRQDDNIVFRTYTLYSLNYSTEKMPLREKFNSNNTSMYIDS